MSEAVTVPGFITMTSIVFEESFARDTRLDRYTHAHTGRLGGSFILNFFKDVESKKEERKKPR